MRSVDYYQFTASGICIVSPTPALIQNGPCRVQYADGGRHIIPTGVVPFVRANGVKKSKCYANEQLNYDLTSKYYVILINHYIIINNNNI